MSIKRKFTIASKIRIGFAVMLIIVIIMGFLAWFQTNLMHEQTTYLYQHPLQVRRIIGEVKANILQVHRDMKNIFIAKDQLEVEKTLADIAAADDQLLQMLHELEMKYLGPAEDVKQLRVRFVRWTQIRAETIRLFREGKLAETAMRTSDQGTGGLEVQGLMNDIQRIDDFSRNKAEVFYNQSAQLNDQISNQLFWIIAIMLAVTAGIYQLLVSSIRNPIQELVAATTLFRSGDRNARSGYKGKDEYGELSEAFNQMADSVEQHLWLGEQLNEMAEVLSGDDEPHAFFSRTIHQLAAMCNAPMAAVYLVDEEKSNLVLFESAGVSDQLRKTFSISNYEGEFGFSLQSHRLHHHKNMAGFEDVNFPTATATLRPQEIITLPLLMPEGLIGIISLASLQAFSEKSLLLLNSLSELLSARAASVVSTARIRIFSDKLEIINQDLEAQKLLLNQSLNYNRGLLEASLDPLVTIGPDGSITDANKATEHMLGMQRKQLIGTDFSTYFTEPLKARQAYQHVFEHGFIRDVELEIRHGDETRPVTYNASVYYDEEKQVAGVFAAARDITERKAHELERNRLISELEQRSNELEANNKELEMQKNELSSLSAALTEQNRELEQQKKQLDDANKLKSLFLANMSHELRTPLNSVISLSGVLSRRLQGKISDEMYAYLDVINKNGKNLLQLINEILDLSRIEAGKAEVTLSRFSLPEVVNELIQMMMPAADENKVSLTSNIDAHFPPIISDHAKVRHILQNLIANAVKFTSNGKVEVRAVSNENGIQISVHDTGIGIAPEKLDIIFDEFRQADEKTSRRFGGSGLGLAIARRYSILCGGNISVTSQLGQGSVFTLELPQIHSSDIPLADRDFLPRSVKAASIADKSGKLILVVEDSDPQLIQLRDMLQEEGYQVQAAKNGLEALELIYQRIPDAIILDLMMPHMDGFEALARIRQSVEVLIPVIILTARHISQEELSFLKGNNISQLLQKGELNREALLARIESVFEGPQTTASTATMMAKILYIEDNPDNQLSMQAMLHDRATLMLAADGRLGLQTAFEQQPDIILLDIHLPDMDGYEVLRKIRSHSPAKHVPVIAVTAMAMKNELEQLHQAGFDAIILKPIEQTNLEETINAYLYGKPSI